MIDTHTQQPIRVVTPERGPPTIQVSQDDVDKVRKLFEAHEVPHWVGHHAISINGKPAVMWIRLRQRADPQAVQELLDQTP